MKNIMSSTETSINIRNAFDVVRKTYTNVNKLFAAIDLEAKNNNFVNIISGQRPFVRFKSDIDTEGWLINDLIKLYQRMDAPLHPVIDEMKLDDSIVRITSFSSFSNGCIQLVYGNFSILLTVARACFS